MLIHENHRPGRTGVRYLSIDVKTDVFTCDSFDKVPQLGAFYRLYLLSITCYKLF